MRTTNVALSFSHLRGRHEHVSSRIYAERHALAWTAQDRRLDVILFVCDHENKWKANVWRLLGMPSTELRSRHMQNTDVFIVELSRDQRSTWKDTFANCFSADTRVLRSAWEDACLWRLLRR